MWGAFDATILWFIPVISFALIAAMLCLAKECLVEECLVKGKPVSRSEPNQTHGSLLDSQSSR